MVNIVRCIAVFVCLIIAASCSYSSPSGQPDSFVVERVSCRDVSSPELRSEVEKIRHNPDGNLYLIAHMKEIVPLLKKLADSGNASGMRFYADTQFEGQYFLHPSDATDHSAPHNIFPSDVKPILVEALTYAYMANISDGAEEKLAPGFRHVRLTYRIEEAISSSWIGEAKTNAQQWKDYCEQ
jgi:hypothetical protein